MQPICKVKDSVDSLFIDLSAEICFVSVLLEIFTIYWRPLEVYNRYFKYGAGFHYKPLETGASRTYKPYQKSLSLVFDHAHSVATSRILISTLGKLVMVDTSPLLSPVHGPVQSSESRVEVLPFSRARAQEIEQLKRGLKGEAKLDGSHLSAC